MHNREIAFAYTSELKAENHAFLKRRAFLRAIAFACGFGLALLLAAPNLAYSERTSQETTKGRKAMELTKTNEDLGSMVPPIDAFAPLRTETATFALG